MSGIAVVWLRSQRLQHIDKCKGKEIGDFLTLGNEMLHFVPQGNEMMDSIYTLRHGIIFRLAMRRDKQPNRNYVTPCRASRSRPVI
jgi:hypothetical protein